MKGIILKNKITLKKKKDKSFLEYNKKKTLFKKK